MKKINNPHELLTLGNHRKVVALLDCIKTRTRASDKDIERVMGLGHTGALAAWREERMRISRQSFRYMKPIMLRVIETGVLA
ncbi:MAG: hypothetical protein PSX71_08725 [bacterium]|nr:hypothetical protein [bacterium]